MRWANDRFDLWRRRLLKGSIYCYIRIYRDNDLSNANSNVRETFFFIFFFFSFSQRLERENRYPGIRRESLKLVSFFLCGLRFYICAKNYAKLLVQRLFLYDWYALSHSEFNLFIVNGDNGIQIYVSIRESFEDNEISTPNLITWQIKRIE